MTTLEPLRVIVNGARGKMGRTIVEALKHTDDILCVGETGRNDDLASAIRKGGAQIVLDVTHPSAALRNAIAILESGAHALIGTTGIGPEKHPELDALARARDRAVLIAPSFSIAAILMMKFAAEAARYFPNLEIVEYHHDTKVDAPSGTALRTAEFINERCGVTEPPHVESEGPHADVSRGARIGNIRIHAVRLPGFVASQEVLLGGPGETLRIRHDPIDRQSYVPGVLHALRTISRHRGLVYGLENLLG